MPQPRRPAGRSTIRTLTPVTVANCFTCGVPPTVPRCIATERPLEGRRGQIRAAIPTGSCTRSQTAPREADPTPQAAPLYSKHPSPQISPTYNRPATSLDDPPPRAASSSAGPSPVHPGRVSAASDSCGTEPRVSTPARDPGEPGFRAGWPVPWFDP